MTGSRMTLARFGIAYLADRPARCRARESRRSAEERTNRTPGEPRRAPADATLAAPRPESPMQRSPRPFARPLKLYAAGHATLLAGAAAMHASGSMLPMALGASACLMLSVPLVRHFLTRKAARQRL